VARDTDGEVAGLRWLLLELPVANQGVAQEPATPSAVASLGRLARAVAAEPGRLAEPTDRIHPAVVQAMRLLDSQPNHRWTLRELADQLHLSPSYLLRLFKSSTSMPPMAYLARRRVETAAGLLLDTTQPVTQIGRSVGWPD
jgi:AraC family L-rhamnose operon transcriptional activator RhaR